MEIERCERCGGNAFQEKDGYKVCLYCKTKYKLDLPKTNNSTIAISDDIKRLLGLCKLDPSKAKKYASLILDIDPNNKEAKRILSRR